MPRVLDLAKKRAVTFVELSYGSTPDYARYCDADENTVFETNTYTAVPEMEIRLPQYTGLLVEKVPTITLPLDSFLDTLSNGQAHAPVSARIVISLESFTPGTPTDDVQELVNGQVAVTVRNPNGKKDYVQLKVLYWKHQSDRPCGIQANAQCYWEFQGVGCVVDSPPGSATYISAVTPSSPAARSVDVDSISGHVLTLTASPSGGPFTDPIFHRGYFEFDGLKIGIREWQPTVDDTVFFLERPAPDDWVGETVSLHQGCDKSLLTCQNRYGNDDFFGGLGVGIRDYNPVFEVRD